jgi:nucleoside-diphosphate-sugar epimerase
VVTVAITGAGGFLGSHLALAVANAGHSAVGVVRNLSRAAWLEPRGVALRPGELGDPESLQRAFKGVDVVIANAALGSPGADGGAVTDDAATYAALHAANAAGVRHTLEAAAGAGVPRVILVSSASVYQTRLLRPMGESTPFRPYPEGAAPTAEDAARARRRDWSDATTDWRYAMTKAAGEHLAWQLAARLGLGLTSLRPGPVHGGRDPKATRRIARSLASPLRLVPTVGVPWIHAGDVAQAAVAAVANPAATGQAYNLAGPPVSLFTFTRTLRDLLARQLGRPLARLVPVPVPLAVAFDTRAAARDLAFAPRPLEVGLAEAIAGLDADVLAELAR